jgi:hypothetical protein
MTVELANESGSQPEVEPSATDADATPAAPDQGVKPDPSVTANGEKLDRQTRNWRALERDRDHWREMAMRQAQPQPQSTPEPEKAEPLKALADFEYDEGRYQKYLHDTLRTSVSNEVRAAIKAEIAAEREREQSTKRRTSYRNRETEFAKTVADYDDVARNPDLEISPHMAEVIQESDDGPALAYYLGKNPDIAANIAQLPPLAAARELGKIEARLAHEREQAKPNKVSKAPPPTPKIEGADPGLKATSTTDPESDKLSDEEWFRLAERERLKKRARD